MKNYIVLDIESPNEDFNSVSAIGIVVVKNNEVLETVYSLINPEDYFDEYIMDMTGITPEMVKDEPKFNEFWPEIEKLLLTNPIVGHNITYDLEVISHSLKNYKIRPPTFKFYDTLKLSYKRLDLNSYSLPDIMKELNIEYDAHNALADAQVTFKLFKYLDGIRKITCADQKFYDYMKDRENDISEEIIPSVNELFGIIQAFRYKEDTSNNQLEIFESWIDENKKFTNSGYLNDILIKIQSLTNEKTISKEDKIYLSTCVNNIRKSQLYSNSELNLQIFTGIKKMINCDDYIDEKEYNYIEKWLDYHDLPENINKKDYLKSLTKKIRK